MNSHHHGNAKVIIKSFCKHRSGFHDAMKVASINGSIAGQRVRETIEKCSSRAIDLEKCEHVIA